MVASPSQNTRKVIHPKRQIQGKKMSLHQRNPNLKTKKIKSNNKNPKNKLEMKELPQNPQTNKIKNLDQRV